MSARPAARPSSPSRRSDDAARDAAVDRWFVAAQEAGEFIGMRVGRKAAGEAQPLWTHPSHEEFDGIGALGAALRRAGADLPALPVGDVGPRPARLASVLRGLPSRLVPRRRGWWARAPQEGGTPSEASGPSVAFAWGALDEAEVGRLRSHVRAQAVTVNTFLLHHLTEVIRPSLLDPEGDVPWMVPVNLRGAIRRLRDTDNHASYVVVRVPAGASLPRLHGRVRAAIERGEPWIHWHTGALFARILPRRLRSHVVRTGRAVAEPTVGAFSNLGVWDPASRIAAPSALGDWFICPPVLRSQPFGAGCVTFRGRMGLALQAHATLTMDPDLTRSWMEDWLARLRDAVRAGPATGGKGAS